MRFVLRGREPRWLAPAAVGVAVLLTLVLTAAAHPAGRCGSGGGVRAVRHHAADHAERHRRGAARRDPADLHRPGRGGGFPGRLLQHRRRGAVPRRGDGHDRGGPLDAGPPRGRRAAGRPGRRGPGRRGVGVPAGVPAPAVRHRRGGHHAAAQPGRGAAAAGTPDRAVAQPRDRVPRLRDLRRGLRAAVAVRHAGARGAADRAGAGRRHHRRPAGHPPGRAAARGRAVAGGGGVLRCAGRPAALAQRPGLRRAGRPRRGVAGDGRAAPADRQPGRRVRLHRRVVATLGGLSALGVLAVALLLGDVQVGRAERLDHAAAAQPDGRRPDLGAAADGGGGAVGAPLPAGPANARTPVPTSRGRADPWTSRSSRCSPRP